MSEDQEYNFEEISPELRGYLNDLSDTLNLIADAIMPGTDPKIEALLRIGADLAFEQSELSKIYDEFELEDTEHQFLFLGKEKEESKENKNWVDEVEKWLNNLD